MRKIAKSCGLFKPQALQRAEIVHIAQFAPQLVHDFPVTRAGSIAVSGLQPFSKVVPKPVVIEERIVDVEQEDGVSRCIHSDVPFGERSGFASSPASTIGAPRPVGEPVHSSGRPLNDGKRLHAIKPEREPDPPRVGGPDPQ